MSKLKSALEGKSAEKKVIEDDENEKEPAKSATSTFDSDLGPTKAYGTCQECDFDVCADCAAVAARFQHYQYLYLAGELSAPPQFALQQRPRAPAKKVVEESEKVSPANKEKLDPDADPAAAASKQAAASEVDGESDEKKKPKSLDDAPKKPSAAPKKRSSGSSTSGSSSSSSDSKDKDDPEEAEEQAITNMLKKLSPPPPMKVLSDVKERFTDVVGQDNAVEKIKEFVDILQDPESFELLGSKCPRGAVFVGPPGTGKTLL